VFFRNNHSLKKLIRQISESQSREVKVGIRKDPLEGHRADIEHTLASIKIGRHLGRVHILNSLGISRRAIQINEYTDRKYIQVVKNVSRPDCTYCLH